MKILIVDDDRSFRKGLAYGLKDHGYPITEACDGKEAYKILSGSRFDLVICDPVMPEADGLEVYYSLQKTNPQTKFILLTAFVDSEWAKLAQKIFKQSFIEKSIGHKELVQSIVKML